MYLQMCTLSHQFSYDQADAHYLIQCAELSSGLATANWIIVCIEVLMIQVHFKHKLITKEAGMSAQFNALTF